MSAAKKQSAYVPCELLCYATFYHGKSTCRALRDVLRMFYSAEEVRQAQALLFLEAAGFLGAARGGATGGRDVDADLDDVLDALQLLRDAGPGRVDLPCFVAVNLARMPPGPPESFGNFAGFARMTELNEKMKETNHLNHGDGVDARRSVEGLGQAEGTVSRESAAVGLPDDVWLRILQQLPIADKLQLRAVSRAWQQMLLHCFPDSIYVHIRRNVGERYKIDSPKGFPDVAVEWDSAIRLLNLMAKASKESSKLVLSIGPADVSHAFHGLSGQAAMRVDAMELVGEQQGISDLRAFGHLRFVHLNYWHGCPDDRLPELPGSVEILCFRLKISTRMTPLRIQLPNLKRLFIFMHHQDDPAAIWAAVEDARQLLDLQAPQLHQLFVCYWSYFHEITRNAYCKMLQAFALLDVPQCFVAVLECHCKQFTPSSEHSPDAARIIPMLTKDMGRRWEDAKHEFGFPDGTY